MNNHNNKRMLTLTWSLKRPEMNLHIVDILYSFHWWLVWKVHRSIHTEVTRLSWYIFTACDVALVHLPFKKMINYTSHYFFLTFLFIALLRITLLFYTHSSQCREAQYTGIQTCILQHWCLVHILSVMLFGAPEVQVSQIASCFSRWEKDRG